MIGQGTVRRERREEAKRKALPPLPRPKLERQVSLLGMGPPMPAESRQARRDYARMEAKQTDQLKRQEERKNRPKKARALARPKA